MQGKGRDVREREKSTDWPTILRNTGAKGADKMGLTYSCKQGDNLYSHKHFSIGAIVTSAMGSRGGTAEEKASRKQSEKGREIKE